MNARIPTAPVDPSWCPRDLELEELALGTALLGYPLPEWLQETDFWATQHRRVFGAIEVLGKDANLATVNAYCRDVLTAPTGPLVVTSQELFAWFSAAEFHLRMGWPLDYDRLRELAKQRRLVECMRRALIKLRHEVVETCDVMKELEELF